MLGLHPRTTPQLAGSPVDAQRPTVFLGGNQGQRVGWRGNGITKSSLGNRPAALALTVLQFRVSTEVPDLELRRASSICYWKHAPERLQV